MRKAPFIGFLTLPFLMGCNQGAGSGIAPGIGGGFVSNQLRVSSISPTRNLKVGRIYRESSGGSGSIYVAGGKWLTEICQNDFRETSALRNLEQNLTIRETGYDSGSYSENVSLKPSIGGIGWDILVGTIGAEYTHVATIEYGKLSFVETTEDAKKTVLNAMGSNCRRTIAEHRSKNRNVFLLSRAVRADTAKISIADAAGVTIGTVRNEGRSGSNTAVATPGGNVGAGVTETFTQRLVFIGVNIGDPI